MKPQGYIRMNLRIDAAGFRRPVATATRPGAYASSPAMQGRVRPRAGRRSAAPCSRKYSATFLIHHFPMKPASPFYPNRHAGGRLGEPSLPMKRCISKVGSFRRNDRVGLSFLQEPLVSRNTATNIPTACSRVGYSADVGPYFFHEPRFSRNTASHIPAVLEPAA